jgi:hypothetical protein
MARSTSFMVLCFVVLAFALGLAQGAYWTEPNVPPCNITSLVCPNLYDTCSGWSHCKQQVPTTMDSCTLYLQRLSVPAGHHFLFKGVNMIYTQKLQTAMNWQLLDVLNSTINVWNASIANPDRPLNWSKPITMWQRMLVTRGPSGEMWNHAFRAQGNFIQPISLSAGEYLFSIAGYGGANPTSYSATLDSFLFWYQSPEDNPLVTKYYDDSFILWTGANMANMYNPMPIVSNNGTSWTLVYPGRLCTWAVGALTNLSDGTVQDPTLNYTINMAGYMVRYFFRQDISAFNVSQFIAVMTDRLNVPNLSPYARVIVYNVQRMYECISVDWYVTSPQGPSAMAVGLAFNQTTVATVTGIEPNNAPAKVLGAFRDS